MTDERATIELKLFGVSGEASSDVRADVFVQKMHLLLVALRAADRQANATKAFDYFISDLRYSSAYAAVAEVPTETEKPLRQSSVNLIHAAVSSVKDGRGIPPGTSATIARTIARLGNGCGKAFSHGEIGVYGNTANIVRIDKFFDRRADMALADFRAKNVAVKLFEGTALGTYIGVLKVIDLRGTVASAKLILDIGGLELDCTCNSVTVDNLKDALDKRVSVSGITYFNGKDRLPEHLEIKRIQKLDRTTAAMQKWNGAFKLDFPHEEDIW